jgi:hypothetical protein
MNARSTKVDQDDIDAYVVACNGVDYVDTGWALQLISDLLLGDRSIESVRRACYAAGEAAKEE